MTVDNIPDSSITNKDPDSETGRREPAWIRHGLDEIEGLNWHIVPVDTDLLVLAIGDWSRARKRGKQRNRGTQHNKANAANACRLDALVRHMSRPASFAERATIRRLLGLSESAMSEALALLALPELGRAEKIVDRWTWTPRMPRTVGDLSWQEGDTFQAQAQRFVPVPEGALWLPSRDFVLLAYLHLRLYARVTRPTVRAGSVNRGDVPLPLKALRAGLGRLEQSGWLTQAGQEIHLSPREGQERFEDTRPEGEQPHDRLKAKRG